MEKIIYVNKLGESVEISATPPFLLEKKENFGSIKNDIVTSKSYSQDGETVVSESLGKRNITIQGNIKATSREELLLFRRKLVKVFNPKVAGKLIYQNEIGKWKLDCRVEVAPKFPFQNSMLIQKFLIQIIAYNPFWKDITENKIDVALWKGNFHFPLVIPTSKGIIMGHREPSLIVNVNNIGDTSCGMKIEFKAKGTLKNPSLFNVNTREFIKINKKMLPGEKITINTEFGNKKILNKLNGVSKNAFNYIDDDSTFLQLDIGDNLFRYNADENLDNLEVSIYFIPKYLGV